MFLVFFFVQIILSVMIWWLQGLVLPLVVFPGMSFFFLIYPRYLLHYNLNQSPTDHGFPDFLLLTELSALISLNPPAKSKFRDVSQKLMNYNWLISLALFKSRNIISISIHS